MLVTKSKSQLLGQTNCDRLLAAVSGFANRECVSQSIDASRPESRLQLEYPVTATVRMHNLRGAKCQNKDIINWTAGTVQSNAPQAFVGQVISSKLSECDNDDSSSNNKCGSNNNTSNTRQQQQQQLHRLKAFQSICPSIFVQSKLAQGQGTRSLNQLAKAIGSFVKATFG